MKATDAVREAMSIREVRPAVLASRLGIKSNVLSERLGQSNISIAKLDEMLRILDYKIVVMPRETRIPEGGLEIE